MKIADIFKQQPVVDRSQQNSTQEAAKEQEAQNQKKADSGSDTIQISSRARTFSTISKVLAEDDASRAARVQDLKAQVEAGEYEVNSQSVAESIVAFANDR